MKKFAEVIEDIHALSTEEMEEVQHIIKKILIEKKREQWEKTAAENQILHEEGKLYKPKSSDDLQKWLAADD